MSTENLLKKTKARRRRVYYPYVNYIVNCNPYKISYDQSDIWLSYLDIVCCGIPANCLRSQPGHNYVLHWTRSSRCRLSLRLCYWGFRLSFPQGLGQLQPSMAGRRKNPVIALKTFFFNNMTYIIWVDKISIKCFVLSIFFMYYLLYNFSWCLIGSIVFLLSIILAFSNDNNCMVIFIKL